jgi:hypothetical protein
MKDTYFRGGGRKSIFFSRRLRPLVLLIRAVWWSEDVRMVRICGLRQEPRVCDFQN